METTSFLLRRLLEELLTVRMNWLETLLPSARMSLLKSEPGMKVLIGNLSPKIARSNAKHGVELQMYSVPRFFEAARESSEKTIGY
jgi:hypothetical protein